MMCKIILTCTFEILYQYVYFSPTETIAIFSFLLPRGTTAKHYFVGKVVLLVSKRAALRGLLARLVFPSSA